VKKENDKVQEGQNEYDFACKQFQSFKVDIKVFDYQASWNKISIVRLKHQIQLMANAFGVSNTPILINNPSSMHEEVMQLSLSVPTQYVVSTFCAT